MTVRKPTEPTNWVAIINAIFFGISLLMMTWLKMEQSDIKATVVAVRHQTDGAQTANLKTLAIAAENLAISSKTEKDKKAASEAWQAYDQRVLDMKQTEKPNP